ncbi:acyl-CoA N-acyltransferase, partial [Chytriomyces sp. MP71]
MITFESVSTERIEQLRVLNQVIFPISYNQSFYHAVLQNSVFCILDHLRTANETCIGAICCRRERNGRRDDGLTSGPPDSLYIMTIGILAPYRRLGIGSSLLSSLITRATDDPTLAYIQLHVQITNTEALAFYAKYGFRVVVRVDGYYRLNKGVIPPDAYLLRRNV